MGSDFGSCAVWNWYCLVQGFQVSDSEVWEGRGFRNLPCSWSAARTRACSFSHFRKILGARGWGGGGGMIPCFWTSASPKRPSSTLSPSKPEALTPKTPNLESFSIPPITFALFCVPDGAASMPDDENATFRNNYLTTTWSTWCEQVLKQPAPPWREHLPDVLKTQPCRCCLHVHHPFQCEQVVK